MIKAITTAQQVLDLFYQDLVSSEDPIVIDKGFAINEVLSARNYLLGQEFVESRKLDISLHGDDYELTEVGGEWTESFKGDVLFDKELNQFYVPLPVSVFTFQYDKHNMGVQTIIPLGRCEEITRIRLNESWLACAFDVTSDGVVWYVQGKRIMFRNLDRNCVKSIIMNVIPSYDDCKRDDTCQAVIPDSREFEIKKMVLDNMFRAYQIRLGKISSTDDGNPNPSGSPEGAPINSLAN